MSPGGPLAPSVEGAPGREPKWLWTVALVAVAVTAFSVRLAMVLRGSGLDGKLAYDDGVYYSAADSLVWGRLPYRDFILLHPPGIVLALAPFAVFGRLTHDALGFESARIGWMLLGSVNAVLVLGVARRLGLVAALAGGLFYAVWQPVAVTETTTRLEPLVSLGVLVGLLVLANPLGERSRRAQVLAGCALGLALVVKIWAVVPVLVVLLLCRSRLGTRATLRVAAAAGVSAAVVAVPFWLAARSDMFRMVVLDQLGRPHLRATTSQRLAGILGFSSWTPWAWATALCLGTLVAMAVLARRSLARWAVGMLAVQVLVLVLSPSYFSFYAAYPAPALALAVAGGVACLDAGFARARTTTVASAARARRPALMAVGVGLAWLVTVDAETSVGVALPTAELSRLTASSHCVTADSPVDLVLLDVLSRDLARGCRVMVDVSGLTYDRDSASAQAAGRLPRRRNRAWQHDLRAYLLSGDTTLLSRPHADGLSAHTLRVIDGLTVLGRGAGYELLATSPTAPSPATTGTRTTGRASGPVPPPRQEGTS